MRTGEDATVLGLYASECCGEELLFDHGDCLTRCPKCQRLSQWELVDLVIAANDPEEPVEAEVA